MFISLEHLLHFKSRFSALHILILMSYPIKGATRKPVILCDAVLLHCFCRCNIRHQMPLFIYLCVWFLKLFISVGNLNMVWLLKLINSDFSRYNSSSFLYKTHFLILICPRFNRSGFQIFFQLNLCFTVNITRLFKVTICTEVCVCVKN